MPEIAAVEGVGSGRRRADDWELALPGEGKKAAAT